MAEFNENPFLKICTNCKHFVCNLSKFDCRAGNTDVMMKWWDENKHKKYSEVTGEFNCCEFTDSMKTLVNMNNIASDI
jgi:hypothetical protein|nr:MAG TPA: hypothetical protein [Caudoviricetes sp.]